ncbi:MAG: glycosyltransferase family 2 protein [Pseudomonadota bacterium]
MTDKSPFLSIITTCKGRLAHLKESLPAMLAQPGAEVVVVDYDCPEATAAYVRQHFPAVKVVKVEGRPYFNNWEARNIGAAQASAPLLVFVDADTMLAGDFAAWVTGAVTPGTYGKMPNALELAVHKDDVLRNGANRLEGLLVTPAATFRELEGYDHLLQGWGAGGDTDLVDRLDFHQHKKVVLPEALVTRAIAHSDAERVRFHKLSISESHLIGLLYRTSKLSMMKLFDRELAREDRARLHALAVEAVRRRSPSSAGLDLTVVSNAVPGSNYTIEQRLTTRVIWRI